MIFFFNDYNFLTFIWTNFHLPATLLNLGEIRSWILVRPLAVTWIAPRPCCLQWRGCFWHPEGSHAASYPTSITHTKWVRTQWLQVETYITRYVIVYLGKPSIWLRLQADNVKTTNRLFLIGHWCQWVINWTHHSDHLCCVSTGTTNDRHRT